MESFPQYILLEEKSSSAFLMVSSMGMLVNNDLKSTLAMKRLWSKLITSLAKVKESLIVQSLTVNGDKIGPNI